MLSLSHSEGLVVWTTLELKQRQSKAVPEDIESLEMCTKSAEWQQKVISLGCGKQGQVRKAMDFTVWMNKRVLAGGKKWVSWYVEFFHTQGSIAIKPFIIPPSSQSSVYLGLSCENASRRQCVTLPSWEENMSICLWSESSRSSFSSMEHTVRAAVTVAWHTFLLARTEFLYGIVVSC